MKIEVSDTSTAPAWDWFLMHTPHGSHVQTSAWGRLKSTLNLSVARVVVSDNNTILGGAQVIIRRISSLGAVGYVPRGPIAADNRSDVLEAALSGMRELAKRYRIRMLVVQPPSETTASTAMLRKSKYRSTTIEVAPVATVLVDLTPPLDAILSNMTASTRKYIRRGKRRGLSGRLGTHKDLPDFYRLMLETCKRQNFSPLPCSYYEDMWRILAPAGHLKMFLVEYGRELVSAQLVIAFGRTLIAKNKGWSGTHRHLGPNYVMDWNTITWGHENGYRVYDFEGIDLTDAKDVSSGRILPSDVQYGPTRYKLQFGGKVELFPGASALVFDPLLRWGYEKVFDKIQTMPIVTQLIIKLRAG